MPTASTILYHAAGHRSNPAARVAGLRRPSPPDPLSRRRRRGGDSAPLSHRSGRAASALTPDPLSRPRRRGGDSAPLFRPRRGGDSAPLSHRDGRGAGGEGLPTDAQASPAKRSVLIWLLGICKWPSSTLNESTMLGGPEI